MAGYLDSYGVTDLQRERRIKQILIWAGAAVVVGLILFLFLHNRAEKQVVRAFLTAVQQGRYEDGYRMWGCTPQTPCRDYAFVKFMEDWGPKGQYANVKSAKVTIVDSCGDGVVETIEMPNQEPFGLWVDRGTKVLGFSPWPRCPGRHWHFTEFFSRLFS